MGKSIKTTEMDMDMDMKIWEYNDNWVELLSNNDFRTKINLYKRFAAESGVMLGIVKERRRQRANGRGKKVTLQKLKDNYNNDEKLTMLLRELFIEPLVVEDIRTLKDKNIDIEKFYTNHKNKPNERFGCIYLTCRLMSR